MVEKRFNQLGIPDIERFENYLPTAFSSELTLLQKVNKIIQDLIRNFDLTNEMVDYLNNFIETFDENLYETVDDILNEWLKNDKLSKFIRDLINEEVIEARTDYLGKKYVNLKERLDSEKADIVEVTEQLALKANKDEVTNIMTPKGNKLYNSLPTTGNTIGDYYYCPDGDGVNGAGNYVWNGTAWYFGGTGDEGYNKLKEDLYESMTEIGVADKSAFTIVPNKYCDSGSLNIYDGNGYAVTQQYLLKKGSKLVVKTKGLNTSLSVVSICNQDNTDRICLIRSIDSTKRTYTYVAPSDMYICLSFAMDDYDIKIYDLKNKDTEATKTAIKVNDNPFVVSKIRQMIYNNSYTEHTNYCCSTPIKLTKGQKLEVTMRCESVVSAISKVNQDGTLISTILKGKGNSQNNYSYVAESDCFVVLCFYVSRDYSSDFNAIAYYPVYDVIEANRFDVVDSMSFSMFERWGVIGDSFASGVYYDTSKMALDNHLQKSWGQILARKSGNVCVNFSMGGLYCGDWLTNDERGLPFLLRESAKELYIVALGINDVGRLSGVQPLGSISDIHSDFSQNPNTFYGNYGKIIGNIKNHAPKAKIIMSTIPYTGESAMIINNAIIAIAQHFELPCLMVHSDKFFRSDYYWNNFEQDHPKSFMYGATANAYERLVLENMRDNTSYWGNTFN